MYNIHKEDLNKQKGKMFLDNRILYEKVNSQPISYKLDTIRI